MASYYSQHAVAVKRQIMASLDKDVVKRLHKIEPWKHFLILSWQYFLLAASTLVLIVTENPWIWIPFAFIQGFTIFNFTVLLHEVVHNAVFVPGKKSRVLNRLMGLVYAFPSGISASQFTRWHLDHHAGLGSPTEDPKRFHLSPKINKRWIKMVYYTPALFFIYFRAAGRETATYQENLQNDDQARKAIYDSISAILGGSLLFSRWRRCVASSLHCACLLGVPHCIFTESSGTALQREPSGSSAMEHSCERLLVLEYCIPLFKLPSGAPLFSRRTVLQSGGSAKNSFALLQKPRNESLWIR